MTTDNDEQIEQGELSEEEAQAQVEENEAAFEAGVNTSSGDEPDDEAPDNDVVTDDDDEPLSEQEEITEAQAEHLFAGKTEAEIAELFDKVPGLEARFSDDTRKLYGRFGDVQSRLQKIEEQSKSTAREILDEDFGELFDEYPELAEMLIKGLKKSQGSGSRSNDAPNIPAAGNAADIEAIIQREVAKVRDEQEAKLLTVVQPDWKKLSQESEFQVYLNGLPGELVDVTVGSGQNAKVIKLPSDAARYVESSDALTSAECFKGYTKWKSAQSKKSSDKNRRLESAMTPTNGRGAPAASTIDDETAFLSGVKKAKGIG